ncbi:MAG TPA: N-methyl-L-tryptophan oxidase, partial [Crinalium sp.]
DLMRAAYPLWFALEAEAGEQLYVKTGGLDIGFPDEPSFRTTKASADAARLHYEDLTQDEVRDRFPQFRLDDEMHALYQEDAGFLRASRCVLAHTRLAQVRGTTVIAQTPVMDILPTAQGVTVKTATEAYSGDRLIITAGSWAKAILAKQRIPLPLRVMPCQLAFFAATPSDAFVPGRFPTFFFHLNGSYGEEPYGIPDDGQGVKVTTFYGWDTVSDPSEVDYTPSEAWVEGIRQFSRHYLPDADAPLVSTRRCLYTVTPDKHFVIDRHPDYPQIVIGAGFSGHGFKFSTLVGKILAELALQGKTEHDISLFQLTRSFSHQV